MDLALATLQIALLCVGLGLAVVAWIPAGRWPALQRWAMAPAVGWSGLGLVSGTMVIVGPAVHVWAAAAGRVLWLLAALAVLGHRRLRPANDLESRRLRALLAAFAGLLVAWLWLASLGGTNFTLFRSNKWDRFNYDALALSLDAYAPSELNAATVEQLAAKNPAYVLVKENLIHDRIGVGGSLAFMSRLGGVRPSDLGYHFGMLGLVLSFPALLWMAWRGGLSFAWALALTLALSVGFWARFLLDVDVLGQLQAMPMAALFGMGLMSLPRRSGSLAVALAVAALAGVYPLYLPVLLGGATLWLILRSLRGARARRGVYGAAALAAAGALVLGAGVMAEGWRQLNVQGKWVAVTTVDWERYHYPWLVNAPQPWRWIAGFWGLEPVGRAWGLYWGLAWALTALALAAAWRTLNLRSRAAAPAALSLTAMGLGLALVLALHGRAYPACRGLAYDYAFAILSLPAGLRALQGRWRMALQGAVGIWIVIQLGSAAQVLGDVAKGGAGLPTFFDQHREIDYRWEALEAAVKKLDPRLLALDLELPWVQERARQVFAGRAFWSVQPLAQYHGDARVDGLRMPAPAQEPDLVLIEKARLPAGLKGKPLLAQTPELALLAWPDLKAARSSPKGGGLQ